MSYKELLKGIWKENPVFIQALGLCPLLAVTNALDNGVAMGFATMFVLLNSNLIVSLLRNFIPSKVRIPCYIVVIATFVTIAGMVLEAYFPVLFKALGIYVPLIVVNCIILGRAEAFASKSSVGKSIMDALGMSFGFMLALVLISGIREFLGTGGLMLFGNQLFLLNVKPALVFILPPGALLTTGLLMALFNNHSNKKEKCAGCSKENCEDD